MDSRGDYNNNGKKFQVASNRTKSRHAKPPRYGGDGDSDSGSDSYKLHSYSWDSRNIKNNFNNKKKSWFTTAPPRKQDWRLAVPSWEKEFALKGIGIYPTWEDFVEAKRYIKFCTKVMEWDDEGAKESFDQSKALFHATKFNDTEFLKSYTPPDPDLYIEKVDWDSNNNDDNNKICELLKQLKSSAISDNEERKEEIKTVSEDNKAKEEIIIPTGWDFEPQTEDPLTGLIVGGYSPYWEV